MEIQELECLPEVEEDLLEKEFSEAVDIVLRGREICSLLPGDKFLRLRGRLLTRLFTEGIVSEGLLSVTAENIQEHPEDIALDKKIRLAKVELAVREREEDRRNSLSRGYAVRFGNWEVAPYRKAETALWFYSGKLVQNIKKIYSRTRWHQEYRWDSGKAAYFCRGFWAGKLFKNPLLVPGDVSGLKVTSRDPSDRKKSLVRFFSALPRVAPYEGYQTMDDILSLSFVQVFSYDREGKQKIFGFWQVTYRVELTEAWELIDESGFLKEVEEEKKPRDEGECSEPRPGTSAD
ncbi:uncharacterized protein LOC127284312 [Leptopilina boulardi]|uniref:uncharacterized protein LOC127284312 n=1 Tax=Leptopilina boulardi TaxID=63433 RepID=UPI0021F59A4D|nr:uncharacterized protein LOC127284312 [Leptopilina boulardi]